MKEGVSNNSAKEAATILRDTIQFAGILVNGVVIDVLKEDSLESKNDLGNERLNENIFDSTDKKQAVFQPHMHNESGNGWSLSIKTGVPLNSEIKRKLIDVTELLGQINNNEQK